MDVPMVRVDSSACEPSTVERSGLNGAASGTTSSQTPQNYALRIKQHAERTANLDIHSGVNYRGLAGFLNRPFAEDHRDATVDVTNPAEPPLVCVKSLVEGGRQTARSYHAVSDCATFEQDPPSLVNKAAHLLWLQGYPAPEWINAIGAQYRVDPEFFRRHLIFLQSKDHHDFAEMPSSGQRMLTLRLTTICHTQFALRQTAIEAARNEATNAVRQHQQRLRTGDSVVRKYSVFDNTIFTIDQELAIYVERKKQHNGWIAIVCSDLGKDLTQGPGGLSSPWLGEKPASPPACEPVIMHVPKLALKHPHQHRFVNVTSNGSPLMYQNASLLADTIDLQSGGDDIYLDVREALHDVFTLIAAAENQFLTMVQGLVDREIQLQSSGKQTEWTLSNLRYFNPASTTTSSTPRTP
ncbi:hypothetical protein LTR10_020250 [Elasticomyces elasticus]|uniref:HNH nuclease domain-containing protein n=1 Tax=Exophiala sideris TaxID=1016849 RepID=A0ABR0IV42_9EURO|nr:hypothetical protein LTR10_020250 [Elasticomyces elasticus]KAK5021270.1 hypothetical protein LTS07_011109 [Exophiala sideris]KAK5024259.1 hypothetical protein LTR13_010968 [Exophiala sideris]KAK5049201.1 hypothetical protein LTR69_011165 [Exophiala sideris]KAK5176511.1 hypothetical protein LTR44_010989 [Eurotiomycetes sp. CCFEE 6388]